MDGLVCQVLDSSGLLFRIDNTKKRHPARAENSITRRFSVELTLHSSPYKE